MKSCVLSFLLFLYIAVLIKKELKVQETIKNNLCGSYPKQEDILLDNLMWQALETPGG
jgi:hypothetical protein